MVVHKQLADVSTSVSPICGEPGGIHDSTELIWIGLNQSMSDDHHKEDIEMTQNLVYAGVPLGRGTRQEAAADITMEGNVGYGVHQARGTRQEAPADITMEENVGYGVHLARGTGQGAAADITMEGNVGYGVIYRNNPQPPQVKDESYEYI
jgi:hypothetical protein